jgi:2-dehydro-3-deoxygalactonokinase
MEHLVKRRRLIIVDWGTSSFRAYRFDDQGDIAERHRADAGILSVVDQAFEATLEREIGGWLAEPCDVLLSGMITSRNGWLETAYVEAPADLAALAGKTRKGTTARGARLRFLPGVAVHQPLPDVMRGEEIQVFGSVASDESALVVLPGTHSKWVRVERGRIVAFRTFLTGEMFALLKAHSIIGRLVPKPVASFNEDAFLGGIAQASSPQSGGLLNDVFTARSGSLLGHLAPEMIVDRLSGLVIGHELKAGLALHDPVPVLRLVGEPALCARYAKGLHLLGQASELGPADAAVEGFRRLAAWEARSSPSR